MDYSDTMNINDPFADIFVTTEKYEDYNEAAYTSLDYMIIFTKIIGIILSLFAAMANIFLIHIIIKFRRLKCTANSFIMQYAIFNLLHLSHVPMLYLGDWIIYDLMRMRPPSATHLYCLVLEIDRTCILFNFLFAFALGIDWYINILKPEWSLKTKPTCKYFTVALYSVGCVKFLLQNFLCFTSYLHTGSFTLSVTYSFILIFTLILDCFSYKYKKGKENVKATYSLTVANIILLAYLPMFIYDILFEFFLNNKEMFYFIITFIKFIPSWLGLIPSILIALILVRMDKHFKMSFEKLFKRSLKDYDRQEENLDAPEEANNSDINITVTYSNSLDNRIN